MAIKKRCGPSANRKTKEARDALGGLGWVRSMRSPLILSREAVSWAERGFGAFGTAPEARDHVLQLALQIEEMWGTSQAR